jgi:hypothetical protein
MLDDDCKKLGNVTELRVSFKLTSNTGEIIFRGVAYVKNELYNATKNSWALGSRHPKML